MEYRCFLTAKVKRCIAGMKVFLFNETIHIYVKTEYYTFVFVYIWECDRDNHHTKESEL